MGGKLCRTNPIRRSDPMKWTNIALPGAYVVELEPVYDDRGFFARTWCSEEFKSRGLVVDLVQCSISYNTRRGTLRGMHYQEEPYAEVKLVRCTAGALYDVILDLRPSSPTYGKWHAMELNATNRKMVYVPKGFAHGFQSLTDHSEVLYCISESYRAESAKGVRWDDSAFKIEWPIPEKIISERDQRFPDYKL